MVVLPAHEHVFMSPILELCYSASRFSCFSPFTIKLLKRIAIDFYFFFLPLSLKPTPVRLVTSSLRSACFRAVSGGGIHLAEKEVTARKMYEWGERDRRENTWPVNDCLTCSWTQWLILSALQQHWAEWTVPSHSQDKCFHLMFVTLLSLVFSPYLCFLPSLWCPFLFIFLTITTTRP